MWLSTVESLNIPAWRPHKIRYTDFRDYTAQSFFSFQTKSHLVSRPLFVNSWREVQEYVLPCSLAIFWKHIGPFRDVFVFEFSWYDTRCFWFSFTCVVKRVDASSSCIPGLASVHTDTKIAVAILIIIQRQLTFKCQIFMASNFANLRKSRIVNIIIVPVCLKKIDILYLRVHRHRWVNTNQM